MAYPLSKNDVPPWKTKFFRGGCYDYARATLDVLEERGVGASLVGVCVGNETHHTLVFIEGMGFFDALGLHDTDDVVGFWSRELGSPVSICVIEDDDLFGYTEDEERYDEAYEDALSELT